MRGGLVAACGEFDVAMLPPDADDAQPYCSAANASQQYSCTRVPSFLHHPALFVFNSRLDCEKGIMADRRHQAGRETVCTAR